MCLFLSFYLNSTVLENYHLSFEGVCVCVCVCVCVAAMSSLQDTKMTQEEGQAQIFASYSWKDAERIRVRI